MFELVLGSASPAPSTIYNLQFVILTVLVLLVLVDGSRILFVELVYTIEFAYATYTNVLRVLT